MAESVLGPLEIELLPARQGDAVLLTWGPLGDRRRLLVDGGPARAYAAVSARLRAVAEQGALELLVLSHIDRDHIDGALLLTNDADLRIGINEYWFNGPAQVSPKLGAAEGEVLAALIGARGIPLNAAFGQGTVCAPPDGPRPARTLPGGLVLTVLGPGPDDLANLRLNWRPVMRDEGLMFTDEKEALAALRSSRSLNPAKAYLSGARRRPDVAELLATRSARDTSASNRSSIVLLAEYAGHRVLLPADATPAALTVAVRRLLAERAADRLELTALMLPHHGSDHNITRELLELMPAEYYLFSSDGRKYPHPSDACVARCLAYGRPASTLVFNYRGPRTLPWLNEALLRPRHNGVRYPVNGDGVTLSLPARHGSR